MSTDAPLQSRFAFEPPSQAAFVRYHAENPQVYAALVRFALEAKRSGRRRLGMKAVFERLRWWSVIETAGDEFVLNNNYTAWYARLVMAQEPELAGFFETRASRADEAA
jgi:hypothetical protein